MCFASALTSVSLKCETSSSVGRPFNLIESTSQQTPGEVAEFLSRPNYTHLFWIDGDIGFEPEAALRLLRAGRDVVAGAYPFKRENWPQQGVPAGTTRQSFEEQHTSYPVNAGGEEALRSLTLQLMPTGSLRCTMDRPDSCSLNAACSTYSIQKLPDYKYVPDWPEGTYPAGGVHYRFFDTMVDPVSRRYLSEDYCFCRLQTIGVDMYIDANSKLTHMGSKLYSGNLAKTLSLAPANAIGAFKGAQIRLTGLELIEVKNHFRIAKCDGFTLGKANELFIPNSPEGTMRLVGRAPRKRGPAAPV